MCRSRSKTPDRESTRRTSTRIFNSFFTTKSHGMGMGLSICRSIIEAHGGRLSILSSNERGSVFKIVLPRGERDDQLKGQSRKTDASLHESRGITALNH